MNHETDTPRKGDYQCQAGILQGDRCKNDATLETRGGYKCCEHHAPRRDSETLRDDVKAITLSEKTTQVSDTPRTDSIDFGWGIHEDEIWPLTRQLERELADSKKWLDERYKALSEADERAEKAEVEVKRLREMVIEAARLGDSRASNFKGRAEKAESLLTQIQAFTEAINPTDK